MKAAAEFPVSVIGPTRRNSLYNFQFAITGTTGRPEQNLILKHYYLIYFSHLFHHKFYAYPKLSIFLARLISKIIICENFPTGKVSLKVSAQIYNNLRQINPSIPNFV